MTDTVGCEHNAYMTTTPGYNLRLSIWFETNKNGRKVAYYWSPKAFRAIRISVLAAEQFIAQEQADRIAGHPVKMMAGVA